PGRERSRKGRKTMKDKSTAKTSAALAALTDAKLHGNEAIETPIGPIELTHNYFDDDASKHLYDEMDYQRAAQAYIWSTPLVSVTTWRDNEGKAYGVKDATDFVAGVAERKARYCHREPHDAVHLQFQQS